MSVQELRNNADLDAHRELVRRVAKALICHHANPASPFQTGGTQGRKSLGVILADTITLEEVELESLGEMVSIDGTAVQISMTGSRDSEARLATTHYTHDSSGPGTRCAFQSQDHAGLTPVSTTQHSGDIQQCAVFDGRHENARVIGVEFVVSEKIFNMWPEDEKLLWHAHDGEAEKGPFSSSETQEIADTYGRVFPSSQSNIESALPLVLSQLLTSSSDLAEQNPELTTDSKKPHVSFAKDEVKPQESTRGSEEGIMPREDKDKASYLLELDGKEDEYLNDAVHRPVVHHRASHMPALTDQRIVDDGQVLAETRSARF